MKKKLVELSNIYKRSAMKKISHFIDGKTYSDNESRKGPIFNPAIG